MAITNISSVLAPIWNLGPQITGDLIGTPYAQYRPQPTGAILPDNLVRPNLPCWITGDLQGKAAKPFDYENPVGASLHDASLTQVGDYLVGALGTLFIASQDLPMPIQVVRCNAVVSLLRPAGQSAAGLNSYGGQTEATDVPVLTEWPASVRIKSKGMAAPVSLPGDARMDVFEVLLPVISGIELRTSDIMTDDQTVKGAPRRFTLSAAESTQLGWRLQVQTTVT